MLEKIKFLFYYLKLRFTAGIGLRQTVNPLDMQWRWKHWEGIKSTEQRRRQLE